MSGELVLMLGTYGTNDALRALMHHDGNAFSKASVRAIIIDATRGTDVHSNAEGVEERLGVIVHMSANVDTWPHDPLGGNRQNFLDSRDVRSFSSLPISGDWLKRCPHLPRPLRRGRTPLSARWSPRPHLQACIDAPLTLHRARSASCRPASRSTPRTLGQPPSSFRAPASLTSMAPCSPTSGGLRRVLDRVPRALAAAGPIIWHDSCLQSLRSTGMRTNNDSGTANAQTEV